ncbi:MAG: 4-hydroxy-3-methylbut-2-enyl diphosphate reductase [Muribaculaceae bacterium]|nr:4-hydroxy-3-methylbut-2-enyl diphosphate reductase [Muribaculaceae bacterium]
MDCQIDMDDRSGFCFGVVTAIQKAEEELGSGEQLFCLGDIVHNSAEVERLEAKGLETITHEDLKRLENARVLLRAHGEPPSTYEIAGKNNITIVDATCPVVLKLQQRIKADYDRSKTEGTDLQIVIYGRVGHAEVNGLVGQTNGEAVVIENPEQLATLDFSRDIALYSQTTKSLEGFRNIIDEIQRRIQPGVNFTYYDTICRQVANRVEHLKSFAACHDVVLFVAGEKSSNGRVLFQHCLSVNPKTYLVPSAEAVQSGWLSDARSIGICGATSTPRWLMELVANRASELTSDRTVM